MTNQNFENNFNEENLTNTTPETKKKRKRRPSIAKKICSIAMAGVLFGSVATGTSYAMNQFLGTSQTASVESTSSITSLSSDSSSSSDASLLTDSSDSSSSSETLDVSTISSQGLTSVVSVTNISVQEVQNYFDQYGRGGMGGSMGYGMYGSNMENEMGGQTQTEETTSVGSGVIIYNDGTYLYMVTNYHVVEDATTLSITFVDDETYEASLCGYDEDRDIAVMKVSISDLSSDTLNSITVASIGSSDDLSVGEQVVAIGNALGYGQSVTTGIVSAVDRTVEGDTASNSYLQTDAAINPGNSGGALFNMSGELVGINTAKISSTGVEGMGYAIPISEVIDMINSFINQSQA